MYRATKFAKNLPASAQKHVLARINYRFEFSTRWYRLAKLLIAECHLRNRHNRGTSKERNVIIKQLKKNYLFHRKMKVINSGSELIVKLKLQDLPKHNIATL